MFITAVCVIFLIKLRWPKNKSLYDILFFSVFENWNFWKPFMPVDVMQTLSKEPFSIWELVYLVRRDERLPYLF